MTATWKDRLLSAAGGALFLFLALAAPCLSLVTAFDLTADAARILWLCLGVAPAVALLLTLPGAKYRSPLALLLALALACAVLWQLEGAVLGFRVVLHQITLVFSQDLPALGYHSLPETMTVASMKRCADLFFTLAIPLLGLLQGCCLLLGQAPWTAAILALALASPGLFLMLEPHPLCLLALLLLLALTALTAPGWSRSTSLGGQRTLLTVAPLLLVMALLAQLFPQAAYERDPRVERLRWDIMGFQLNIPAPGSLSSGAIDPRSKSFDPDGPPRYTGRTVLQVRAAVPQERMLLRGWSNARYTAQGWQDLPDEAYDGLDLAGADVPVWCFPALGQSGTPREVIITGKRANDGVLFTPYYPVSIPQGLTPVRDAYLPSPTTGSGYQIFCYPISEADVTLIDAAAETDYRAWVYDHYLDMPDDLLSPEARTLIDDFAAGHRFPAPVSAVSSPVPEVREYLFRRWAARTVTAYLAQLAQYDPTTPAQPQGEDFVSHFLTESHRGYCLHFATAGVLLLRSLGIPARFVTGYVADVPEAGVTVDIPDANAHAWVEYYVNGFGWEPVDVTPGYGPSGGAAALSPSPSATPTPTPTPSATPTPTPAPPSATPTPGAAPTPDGADPSQSPGAALRIPWGALLGGAVGVLAPLGLIRVQYCLRTARRRRRCSQADPNAAVLELYHFLEALHRHSAVTVPDEALSLAKKAAFSQHVLTGEERAAMAAMAGEAARAALPRSPLKRLVFRYFWALG